MYLDQDDDDDVPSVCVSDYIALQEKKLLEKIVFVYEMGSSIFLVASNTQKYNDDDDGTVLETRFQGCIFIILMKDVKKIDDFMNINFALSM